MTDLNSSRQATNPLQVWLKYIDKTMTRRQCKRMNGIPVLTCIGNDFGYDDVFSRQVEALGRSGDILVGISTSGRSPNVNGAFRAASRLGVTTIGLLGKGGGEAVDIVDHAVVVPSASTARIQESHILIGHMFCEIIEQELGLA